MPRSSGPMTPSTAARSRTARWVRYSLRAAPLLLVLVPLAVFSMRLASAARVEPARVESILAQQPVNRCGDERPELLDGDGVPALSLGAGQVGALPSRGDRFVILAVGGSTLVVPSAEETFPAHLERELAVRTGLPVSVVNAGHVGATAARVCERGLLAQQLTEPDLVLIYSGHNDFTATFRSVRERHLLPIRPRELRWIGVDDHRRVNSTEPRLAQWLQSSRLLSTTPELLDPLTVAAIGRWTQGIEPLVDAASDAGRAVVYVRPVGNLEIPPVGLGRGARDAWLAAGTTTDMAARMEHLRSARDGDAFNGDIRAKSAFADALHALASSRPDTHYLDLEAALEQAGFRFANEDFFDLVHPRPSAHEQIAAQIATFLLSEGLCCEPRVEGSGDGDPDDG